MNNKGCKKFYSCEDKRAGISKDVNRNNSCEKNVIHRVG